MLDENWNVLQKQLQKCPFVLLLMCSAGLGLFTRVLSLNEADKEVGGIVALVIVETSSLALLPIALSRGGVSFGDPEMPMRNSIQVCASLCLSLLTLGMLWHGLMITLGQDVELASNIYGVSATIM